MTVERIKGGLLVGLYRMVGPTTCTPISLAWECPRCGRINAPWVRHCDCTRPK